MAFCKNCGKELENGAAFCPGCGTSVENTAPAMNNPADKSSFGFALLGFFFPLIGLILWLVWKGDKPLKAKSAGKGALVGVIVSVVLSIIYSVIIGAMVASLSTYY